MRSSSIQTLSISSSSNIFIETIQNLINFMIDFIKNIFLKATTWLSTTPIKFLKDYKEQESFARLSGFFCIFFSCILSLIGIYYVKADRSFISTLVVQFLGTSVILYGTSKATEASAIKSTGALPPKPDVKEPPSGED